MSPCKNVSSSCCASATCGGGAKQLDNCQSASSPSSNNLQLAAKSSLASFLSTRLSSNGDIAQDVYRAMRDEANLLLERQLISDALDSDPFELMRVSSGGENEEAEVDKSALLDKKKNREMIERFKNMMSVISCERTTTLEGYSRINAVVQLQNDGMMRGVNDNVRLHFTFVREPQQNNTSNNQDSDREAILSTDATDDDNVDVNVHESNLSDSCYAGKRKRNQCNEECNKRSCTQKQDEADDETSCDTDNNNDDSFTPKTIVTYKIDMSVDYGQMETLLGVDIYALGEHPSVEEAMPMMHEEDEEDDDENSDPGCDDAELERDVPNTRDQASEGDDFEEVEMTDTDDTSHGCAGKGDRFGVFADPQLIVGFLDRVNMNLNEQSVMYLLLTLPLYEHEWDISGFVLSTMFDDDDDDDAGMDEDGSE